MPLNRCISMQIVLFCHADGLTELQKIGIGPVE